MVRMRLEPSPFPQAVQAQAPALEQQALGYAVEQAGLQRTPAGPLRLGLLARREQAQQLQMKPEAVVLWLAIQRLHLQSAHRKE